MESSVFFKKGWWGLVALATIGLASLAVTFAGNPFTQIFIKGDNIKSSAFNISLSAGDGQLLFTVSPLNDFYYTITGKDHFADKIIRFNNGNLLENIWLASKALLFNQQELAWNTLGKSLVGEFTANYLVESTAKGVVLQRQISPADKFNYVGQVIKFCPDCLVTDAKKRAYFNADTVQQADINTATRLGLTPVVVGENQFLSLDVAAVNVVDRENNPKFTIPLNGAQVYLDYRWRLLEFKVPLGKGQNLVKQEIYLDE
jgi:hypothetical protein